MSELVEIASNHAKQSLRAPARYIIAGKFRRSDRYRTRYALQAISQVESLLQEVYSHFSIPESEFLTAGIDPFDVHKLKRSCFITDSVMPFLNGPRSSPLDTIVKNFIKDTYDRTPRRMYVSNPEQDPDIVFSTHTCQPDPKKNPQKEREQGRDGITDPLYVRIESVYPKEKPKRMVANVGHIILSRDFEQGDEVIKRFLSADYNILCDFFIGDDCATFYNNSYTGKLALMKYLSMDNPGEGMINEHLRILVGRKRVSQDNLPALSGDLSRP
jgi:hypothetical protein